MKNLLIHSENFVDAYDIKEIFYHHSKVKEEPEILFKIQTYNQPNGKRFKRKTYLTMIKMGN